jgi:hypothetical protein
MTKRSTYLTNLLTALLVLSLLPAQAQTGPKSPKGISLMPQERRVRPQPDDFTAQAGPSLVQGSGTVGRIPKWKAFNGTNYILGDSIMTETTSGISVAGTVSATGGVKFPDGTVQTTAGLAAGQTLLVRDLDNPARQPVAFKFFGDYTVPAGKRLVIEYVSGFYLLPTDATLQPVNSIHIGTVVNNQSYAHYALAHRSTIDTANSRTHYTVGQSLRIYADPGTQVELQGIPNNIIVVSITFSGYLVDVP